MEPAKKGMKNKEVAKLPRHPFVGGVDYRRASKIRRSLGWGADSRTNEGN